MPVAASTRTEIGAIEPSAILDELYFSIVTFTTPGYGDLHSVPDGRIYAALKALTGYIYLGLIIGLSVNGFTPSTRKNGIQGQMR